jgi:hypothetical protein
MALSIPREGTSLRSAAMSGDVRRAATWCACDKLLDRGGAYADRTMTFPDDTGAPDAPLLDHRTLVAAYELIGLDSSTADVLPTA